MSWVLAIAILQGGVAEYLDLVCLLAFFLGLFGLCVLAVAVCLDSKFLLEARGMRLPSRYIWPYGVTRFKEWKHLKEVRFERWKLPSTRPSDIRLCFAGNSNFSMKIEGLSREALKDLFLSIESRCPDAQWTPAFSELEVDLTGLGAQLTGKSFTQLWEEELASKFTSTVYVPLEPGNTLQDGRLTVTGQACFGGLSAIYLARDSDGSEVVLKEAVVPANSEESLRNKALEMFAREAKILASLDHPRIVRVLDNFVENRRNYLVLQHVDGKDLRAIVHETGPQDEDVVLVWALEISRILEYLHSLEPPVVHRDLTPDNLVLANDGNISLIDFGAANSFLGTATGTLVGKQCYIAPEQFRGKAIPQSDLYSLGATLQFLLTGKDPEPLSESSPGTVRPEVSKAIDDLVLRLTAMEASERFASASAVTETILALRNTRRGKVISVSPSGDSHE